MIFNKDNDGSNEIAEIATWTADHDYRHISKALLLAKRKVLKIIDKETYKLALSHYQSENYKATEPSEEHKLLDSLVFWFQTVYVNFAYEKNIAKDSVLWNNSGISVAWSVELRPAQQAALDNVSDSLKKDAYEFLDLLIDFLNENSETFTGFKSSVENKKIKQLFINNAEEFCFYFNINGSVSYFFEILDVIRRVQRTTIFNTLGSEYYNKVKDYQEKRLELEKITDTVLDFENLPQTPEENTICLVKNTSFYYKYTESEWIEYAYNACDLLELIKPALVDYTMYNKFYSDISNLKADKKQIEIIRANADFLKKKADGSLSSIVNYIESLNVTEEVSVDEISDEETSEELKEVSVAWNSLMI